MNDPIQQVCDVLVERFNAEQREYHQQITLVMDAEVVVKAFLTLRDELKFNMLMDVTAVDYLGKEPRFNVVYQLYSMEKNVRLSVRVPVSGTNPQLPTVESVYPSANWYEREVMDMFGIKFIGHSDPRRIIMPADWQGHPLRKDYPLGYEEVQFTFNFEEIDLRKPKGKEF
ncbi:MAG: NADH-quinone oxidoreductase subunit C [Anaerolineae bacterium]|nr:NADH-quinone oxidoreductase subunit C [Anaerolineae bacterium]